VHLIVYHIIWCPRRRKSILVGTIKERCQQHIEEKCKEQGWLILSLAIQPDHIHVFVRIWPANSAAAVVK
jgi:putative transposase